MSYLHDEIDDQAPHSAYQESARELTLGTGTILTIFFGLALLCAVFFGFGYSMGSKTRPAPIVAAETPRPDTANFNSFKPAPGSPASQSAARQADAVNQLPAPITPKPSTTEAAPIVRTSAPVATPVSTKPVEAAEVPAHAAPAVDPAGSSVVQVAAVSHQEDADLLIAALKRKGYSVIARSETQDKLIHIQVGPFASKKDAEVMRQRLLSDGYNAIVK